MRNLAMTLPPRKGDDGPRDWLCNFYPVIIDSVRVGLGVVALDVTDQRQAEGFQSSVMSQLAEGVYTLDREGHLTYMNRAGSRMLGWTEAELRGRPMHDVVHFQRADGTPVPAAQCPLVTEGTEHPVVQSDDEAFTRKDGTVFPVAFSSMPLRVGTHVEGVSVVFHDLTDPRTPTNPIRVLIADADPVASGAMTTMLTRHEGVVVVSVAATASDAVRDAVQLRPDVVLVDAALPQIGGPATTVRIRADAPDASVVLMAVDYDEAVAAAAIAAGCVGVVDKDRAWVDLADAVRAAYHGGTAISQQDLQRVVTKVRDTWTPGRAENLTDRERQVLVCLTQGLSNQGVADQLGVTVNTIRNHVQRILYKLDVHSKLEAVVVATRDGLLDVVP